MSIGFLSPDKLKLENHPLKNIDIDFRIILKWILSKPGVGGCGLI
jgi:hypothetical protein